MENILHDFNENVISLMTEFLKNSIIEGGLSNFTDDLNANGNDIMYQAELESRYSFQKQSDDFGVCKLYCRDETRFYIGNKLSVKAGQNLRYDIGQTLIDKKIINETAKDKGNKYGFAYLLVQNSFLVHMLLAIIAKIKCFYNFERCAMSAVKRCFFLLFLPESQIWPAGGAN